MTFIAFRLDRWLRHPHSTPQSIALGVLAVVIGAVASSQIRLAAEREQSAELQRRFAAAADFHTRFDRNVRDAGKVSLTLVLPLRVKEGASLPIKAMLKNHSRESVA